MKNNLQEIKLTDQEIHDLKCLYPHIPKFNDESCDEWLRRIQQFINVKQLTKEDLKGLKNL